jgi:hypothetical protein
MRKFWSVPLAALLLAATAGCDESPVGAGGDPGSYDIVVTQGAPAPAAHRYVPLSNSNLNVDALVQGSSTTPLSLNGESCTAFPNATVEITYRITGNQAQAESFKVHTLWTYNGTAFTGSNPTTVNSPARSPSTATTVRSVTLTVANGTAGGSGSTSFLVEPFDNTSNGNPNINTNQGGVMVNVAFNTCAEPNTAPTLVLPVDITEEATSSLGATVTFSATATDAEDGDITHLVECSPASGSTFPLGVTTVTCSVTDSDGATVSDDFNVTVEDTTPPEFDEFPADQTLIAADINGAVLNFATLTITAEDAVTAADDIIISCEYSSEPADLDSVVGIGSTRTVVCTATDEAGNKSDPQSFGVTVTLDVASGAPFLSPLRMLSPFSAHKLNSTIPHKFPAPRYADGSLATDLAGDLTLVLTRTGIPPADAFTVDGNDYSTGSTAWRYDPDAEHYIFNLKTGNKSPWAEGRFITSVSYMGVLLAETELVLKK